MLEDETYQHQNNSFQSAKHSLKGFQSWSAVVYGHNLLLSQAITTKEDLNKKIFLLQTKIESIKKL